MTIDNVTCSLSRARSSAVRSRWAAFGALLAVALGAGTVLTTSAAGPVVASSFVPITPCRLMDTRLTSTVGPRNTPLGSGETYSPLVWGTNGGCTIPSTATGVSMNVTFSGPTARGYVSVFPADQAWPGTSNLNFLAGQSAAPNTVTSQLSADGHLAFLNSAGTVNLIADVVGYYEPAGGGARPDRILWVANGHGDYTSVSAALNAIGTTLPAASESLPYLIRIAPGIYTEAAPTALKDHVDIEGSGRDITTITCACSGATAPTSATLTAGAITAEVRHLTVINTGGAGNRSTGVYTGGVADGSLSLLDLNVAVSGTLTLYGVTNDSSSPAMTGLMITVIDGDTQVGVSGFKSSPLLQDVEIHLSGSTFSTIGMKNDTSSSPTLHHVGIDVDGSQTFGTTEAIANSNNSSPIMSDVDIVLVGGASSAVGVYVDASTLTATGTTIDVTAGSGAAAAVVAQGASVVTIHHSSISATGDHGANSVLSTTSTTRIANSTLVGAVSGAGFVCIGVISGAFTPLNGSCL